MAETNEPSILDKVLSQEAPKAQAKVDGDSCYNCSLHGKTTKLKDGVCPDCGYTKPRG